MKLASAFRRAHCAPSRDRALPIAAACVAASLLGAAAVPAGCADPQCSWGQARACRGGECRCGAMCISNSECGGGQVCAELQYDLRHGVCVESAWAGVAGLIGPPPGADAGTTSCPACQGSDICVDWSQYALGPRCTKLYGPECQTCFVTTGSGYLVCAPSMAACGMPGTCYQSSPGGCTDPRALFCGSICCPANYSYACASKNQCYASESAAAAGCAPGNCTKCGANLNANNICEDYVGGGTCGQIGQLNCGPQACCRSTSPYYCSATQRCYSVESDAVLACGSNTRCVACK